MTRILCWLGFHDIKAEVTRVGNLVVRGHRECQHCGRKWIIAHTAQGRPYWRVAGA